MKYEGKRKKIKDPLGKKRVLDFPVPAGIVIPVAVFRALRSIRAARAELRAALAQLAGRARLARTRWPYALPPRRRFCAGFIRGRPLFWLNVVGADAILAAILDVWASVSAPAAQAYRAFGPRCQRRNGGIDHAPPGDERERHRLHLRSARREVLSHEV